MELTSLTAISPIDGRYRKQVNNLAPYFSEFGLIRYRVLVEIEYFFLLADKKFFTLNAKARKALKELSENFSTEDAQAIKEIEKTTNHDVKAVEYYIKQILDKTGAAEEVKEFVHFGLTSQDVNNTAIPLSFKHAMEFEYLPALINLQKHLHELAVQWRDVALLARTHGQPASPTRLGKEIMVFVERIDNQVQLFSYVPYAAKFGGATGNFNAHHIAYPKTNWIELANHFVEDILGLQRMQFTTQIEHYDHLAAHFDCIKRINNILIDLCRDIWTYISQDYFKQKTKKGEVGSSAMPHKVNPIDFENLGIPVAHTMIALASIEKGLNKLVLNEKKIAADLEDNWAVVAEAIQTVLRRENYPNPYEALKELTRGASGINKQSMHAFIDGLKVSAALKKELKKITPSNYTGICPEY
ncbi:MAG: adenylosuccinate lyase [Chitinophagaceae bacterium]|nr:adenylosuccinate lyase [Chitinophagaceae bacterium]